MVSAGGGCQAAVTARTRCEWVKLSECLELPYCRRFALRLKVFLWELCKANNTV